MLAALAAGKLNKQIAADLGVVEQTVKFHRARIMDRMQAKTSAELMPIAGRLGIGARTRPQATAAARRRTRPQPRRRKRRSRLVPATNPKVSYGRARDAVTFAA